MIVVAVITNRIGICRRHAFAFVYPGSIGWEIVLIAFVVVDARQLNLIIKRRFVNTYTVTTTQPFAQPCLFRLSSRHALEEGSADLAEEVVGWNPGTAAPAGYLEGASFPGIYDSPDAGSLDRPPKQDL